MKVACLTICYVVVKTYGFYFYPENRSRHWSTVILGDVERNDELESLDAAANAIPPAPPSKPQRPPRSLASSNQLLAHERNTPNSNGNSVRHVRMRVVEHGASEDSGEHRTIRVTESDTVESIERALQKKVNSNRGRVIISLVTHTVDREDDKRWVFREESALGREELVMRLVHGNHCCFAFSAKQCNIFFYRTGDAEDFKPRDPQRLFFYYCAVRKTQENKS